MTATTPAVGIVHIGHVAQITLQRPERLNTLARDMVYDLRVALDALRDDPKVRVVIITGAGDRAFCAGADLNERRGMNEAQVLQTVTGLQELTRRIATMPQPTIAAVNGYAFGGGLEIALACDLRYMSENARVGLTETRLAIIPGAGGTQRLPRLIGLGRAREMIFRARRITADTAAQWGLCEDVFPIETLRDAVHEIAEEIAQAGPLALIQAKIAINQGIETTLDAGLAIERDAYRELIPTQDRIEALEAFLAKRPPNFEGK